MSSNPINKQVIVAAYFGIVYSIFSIVISDIHTFTEIIFGTLGDIQNNTQYLFYFSGVILGPVLSISIVFFGIGLIQYGKYIKERWITIAGISAIVSCLGQVFLGIVDYQYGIYISDLLELRNSNQGAIILGLRGLSTLVVGLFGGIILGFALLKHFIRNSSKTGIIGILIFLSCILFGIIVKMIAKDNLMLALIFIILMNVKSLGMIIANIQILRDQEKWLTTAST